MDKKLDKKALAAAVGTAFAVSMATAPIASADSNPFGMNDLGSGYQQVAAEGQCGGAKGKEGQCGSSKAKKEMGDGNCGAKDMPKGKEGQCGAMEKGKAEGICGADTNKDGKITEAEFIAAKGSKAKGKFMQFDADKDGALNADELAKLKASTGPKAKEGNCGGKPMPKGKEGQCGEGKCGK